MSEFKIGDIVYYEYSDKYNYNDNFFHISYEIIGIFGNWINIIDVVETGKRYTYKKERFISEREYIINQRKEKILKLKDGIKRG